MAAFPAVTHLQVRFNDGAFAESGFAPGGGLNTFVTVDEAENNRFKVFVHPHDDLWLTAPVTFEVSLPAGFPQARPSVRCVQCDEAIRSDPRLLMLVEQNVPTPPTPDSSDGEGSEAEDGTQPLSKAAPAPETPKLYRSRIEKDGTVHSNLFESRYMGWLQFYDIEVIVHTLRLLFRKTDAELAPTAGPYVRSKPVPLLVESGMYEEQGPRRTMEDRVCVEDFRFVPYGSVGNANGVEQYDQDSSAFSDSDIDSEVTGHTTTAVLASTTGTPPSPGTQSLPPPASTPPMSPQPSLSLNDSPNPQHAWGQGRKVSLHAVLDGHGGHMAADIASVEFENRFFNEVANEKVGVERALYNAVVGTEAHLAELAQEDKKRNGHIVNTSGSTLCAVAVNLDQGVAFCANVGDSRAVLCRRDGKAVNMSTDHKASRPDEVARVVHIGGFVSYGRVLGMLAVSRALGDPEMKAPNQLVQSVPSMTRFELEADDEFILIACDGVFDVLSSQEAVDFVRAALQEHAGDVEAVSTALVRHALGALRSQDNVSVIIIKLNPSHGAGLFQQSFTLPAASLDKTGYDSTGSGIASLPDRLSPLTVSKSDISSRITLHRSLSDGPTLQLSATVQAAVRASRLRKRSSAVDGPSGP